MGDAHLHWHLYPRRNGDIENYGNNGKGLVQWYPMDKMYSDENRPFDVELDKMNQFITKNSKMRILYTIDLVPP